MYSPAEPSAPTKLQYAGEVGRWLAMIPVGLVCALLALFPLHWGVLLLTGMSRDDGTLGLGDISPERLEAWGMGLLLPWVFVVIGAAVAPRFKPYTAGGLGILWVLTYAVGLTWLLTYNETSGRGFRIERWDYLQIASVVVLNVVGSVGGFFQVLTRD